MLFLDVGLEFGVCSETEMNGYSVWTKGSWNDALWTEELGSSVNTLFVLAEANCSIKSSIARLTRDRIDIRAGIWSELEMFGTDMALESLMLPEGLVAWWVCRTPKPLMPFVRLFMSLETSRCEKTLVAALPIAMI
jgi:hypothetical protein